VADPESDEGRHPDTGIGQFFARAKYRQRHSLYVWQFVTARKVLFYLFVLLHTFSRTLHATPGVLTINADTFPMLAVNSYSVLLLICISAFLFKIRSSVLKRLMIRVVCEQHSNTLTEMN